MNLRACLSLLLAATLLSACAPARLLGLTASATPRPSTTPVPTLPPIPTSTATLPAPTAAPPVPLAGQGPWLTYLHATTVGSELVAANPDGSARTVIGALPDVFVPVLARRTNCATACWFSLYNGRDQSLTLFQLPDGVARKSFQLLSNKDLTADQRRFYASLLNQNDPPNQAWSPDGRYLAFIGAMDGAFSDLYLFDTQGGSLNRLTGNVGETFFPTWSPDGQWILVQEIGKGTSTGQYTVQSVYAFSVDPESGFKTLYHPASFGEKIFGWNEGENSFVVASRRSAGLVEARRYMLDKRTHAQLKYSGAMDVAAYSPEKGILAFAVTPKDKNVPSLAAGLYWTSPAAGAVPVQKGKWLRIGWSPPSRQFFAVGGSGVLLYTPGGEKVLLNGEDTLPEASPDGNLLAFYSADSGAKPGLRLYDPSGKLDRAVTDLPVQEVLWRPASDGLFFISDGSLYSAAVDGGDPVLLERSISNLGWVGSSSPRP